MKKLYINGVFDSSDLPKGAKVKKINCAEYKIEEIEEIVTQQNLFSKNVLFLLYNFDELLEKNNSKRILMFLKRAENSLLIINMLNGINQIKDESLKQFFKDNFEIIDLSKAPIKKERLKDFVDAFLSKYGIEKNETIEKVIELVVKKVGNNLITAEKVLDEIFFDQVENGAVEWENIDEGMIEYFVSIYKEINQFVVANLFLELLLRKETNSFEDIKRVNRNRELILRYLEMMELDDKIDELWGLIFSQIVALIKIYDQYCRFGDRVQVIANNLKMNSYRVMMLMRFVKNLDYLIKHKDFSISHLLSSFLESEIRIKSGFSTYIKEIEGLVD